MQIAVKAEAVGTAIIVPGRQPLKKGTGLEWQSSLWGEDAEGTEFAGKRPCPAWACAEGRALLMHMNECRGLPTMRILLRGDQVPQ